jgi:hypothetical protein
MTEWGCIMSDIVKMKRAYDCLISFRDNCSEEYKEFINIFFPMLYRDNIRHCLKISIGKKMSESKFYSALSATTTKFVVKLSCCKNEPQFSIYDMVHHEVITSINLALVKDLHIENNEYDSDSYDVAFNYNNEFDYCIHIGINKVIC